MEKKFKRGKTILKKTISLVALFSAALCLTLVSVSNKALARTIGLHRVSSSYINKVGERNQYYRLNQNTKVRSGNKKVTLPKGTIINAEVAIDNGSKTKNGKALISAVVDLSYALKKKVGVKYPAKLFVVYLSYYPSKYTRVKAPAYVLPYGNNVLYSGGVTTFKNRATKYFSDLTFTSNALKITSDGYLEFYKYHKKPLGDGALHWAYAQKPSSYVKISYALNKGSKKYLYFQHKLSGAKATHLKQGNYRYRLTINNLHTPYQYSGKVYDMWASFYTVSGSNYFTSPLSSTNSGD